jgi:hypothetical protein
VVRWSGDDYDSYDDKAAAYEALANAH